MASNPQPSKKRRGRKRLVKFLAWLIPLGVAIWGVMIVIQQGQATPPLGVGEDSPSSSQASSASTSIQPSDPTTASASDSTPPTQSTAETTASKWYYLSELSPEETKLEGRSAGCTGGCTGFGTKPTSISGTLYPHTYKTRLDSSGARSTSTWNALKKCTRFEATIGLSDDSISTNAKFEIQKDEQEPIELAKIRTGATPVEVSIDMREVFRFVISSNLLEPTSTNNQQSAAWGDARLYCTALSDI